jgi:hypothetical protein
MAIEVQHDFWGTVSAIALAIVGVAILAVVVSKNANTVGVIGASASAFTGGLATALSPITGNSSTGMGGSIYPI